ncbi:GntR family transcriptional regulator [Arthrobacter sp. NPDC056886]|uniref:GntR family transcriptional regulator n=1 Tax=Arthrobacter sp. NPDC056886 TaxID=3345960 RepID=UPI00366BAA9F
MSESIGSTRGVRVESTQNLSTEVYESIRRSIVEGEIRPNERLIEAELAERLDVSRTPIRESMQRLAADGLVVSRRRGWVVREHSSQEIRDIYEVRAALEGYAARLAAERATDDEIAEIVRIHESYIAELENTSRGHLLEHNDKFHDAVVAASKNARMAEQIVRNSSFYFVHRIAGFWSDDDVRVSIAGHQELVDALVARDPEAAELAARRGVLSGLNKTLARIS